MTSYLAAFWYFTCSYARGRYRLSKNPLLSILICKGQVFSDALYCTKILHDAILPPSRTWHTEDRPIGLTGGRVCGADLSPRVRQTE